MNFKDILGITFKKVKTLNSGNIYAGSGLTLFLKATDREYSGKAKKPSHYLSQLENGTSTYLSGLFPTDESAIFSADYKDDIGVKHLVKICFTDQGNSMVIE
jgi:hypothetical protein